MVIRFSPFLHTRQRWKSHLRLSKETMCDRIKPAAAAAASAAGGERTFLTKREHRG